MKIIVEKYGGSSLSSIDRIKQVAYRVAESKQKGFNVVVVVSAIGDTTDELLTLADQITKKPSNRELGLLLSTGEMVSSSLLAMALSELGYPATALTGWQCGIDTQGNFDEARISHINPDRILHLLKNGEIPIVTGYQGIQNNDITVLGRGGSDTTAVALAAALNSNGCTIYTDVPGIFTADPRIVENASILKSISYEEMIELAGSGAQVMMGRAVEIARRYSLDIKVRSSFERHKETVITSQEKKLEDLVISGITATNEISLINIVGINMHDLNQLLGEIAQLKINIKILTTDKVNPSSLQSVLVMQTRFLNSMENILKECSANELIEYYQINKNVSQVSVVGYGISENYGVASTVFNTLTENGIDILLTSTSEIKISVIIPRKKAILAVKLLHDQFGLANSNRKLDIQNEVKESDAIRREV